MTRRLILIAALVAALALAICGWLTYSIRSMS